ncbi:natural resistance-associated macrophage protein [Russula earlei]|uniref:Natural resistance-associated macrophage protein n=1 Tax=Russula earlei TaxID=71964 RepID=A0ACC0UJV4_9AGAM|nr:natural resistance-associated macrophage protein [Russula earlei]
MSELPSRASTPSIRSLGSHTRPRKWVHDAWIYITRHVGVGIICSVAYFDPGNWAVDLQAGSEYGYHLLFVVLLAGCFAVILQSLACKLGVVTGLDLAAHCRLLLYNRTRHPKLCRWLILYPLYICSELAIIATDLAELLGSAIALNLLFPSLPLWGGVLLTALDVLLILAFADPLHGRPVRSFEFIIGILVLAVLVCMCILVSRVRVDWDDAFHGFLPSKSLFHHGGLYTSVGILGATVMPHTLFLGSALATQDRASVNPVPLPGTSDIRTTDRKGLLGKLLKLFRPVHVDTDTSDEVTSHANRPNNSLLFVKAHLHHAVMDIVVSLLFLAVTINALILIVASAVFSQAGVEGESADIYDAHSLLRDIVGMGAAVIFALALLCSGQSASLVATVAGQLVSEGFLRWRVSPIMRRLLTRLLSLIPSMAVAVAIGRSGISTMLIASQVVLSIVLPFIIFPLVWLTSSRSVMRVRVPPSARPSQKDGTEEDTDVTEPEYQDYSNGRIITGVGYIICFLILVANGYVLVALILGA